MKEEDKKPRARSDPAESPYEELCGKQLTVAEEAEINFNLVNFVKTLIAMDRQKQAWDKNKKNQSKEEA